MKQLPGDDAIFLAIERDSASLHMGAITIVDPSQCKDFGFEKLRTLLAERVPRVPKLTWKVRQVPLGIDRPYWQTDSEFSVDRHLHRMAVPKPGGDAELKVACGEILSRRLDRRLPLWELWYIDGLAHGRVAILMKMHPCLFDGVSGAGLGEILADLEPNPAVSGEAPVVVKFDQPRSDLELYARGLWSLAGVPWRAGKVVSTVVRQRLGKLPRQWRRGHQPPASKAPRALFNGQLSARRGVTYCQLPLARIKAIKNHFGLTVNDVVLALCSGAMRHYLLAHDELPAEPLVCWVPKSERASDDHSLQNKVGTMAVSLQTHIADPVERMLAIRRCSDETKAIAKQVGSTNVQAMGTALPPALIQLVGWVFDNAQLDDHLPVTVNTVISNIPGPPVPLYIAGAVIEAMYPLAPIMLGMGFNITIMSYMDQVGFGFMLDPYRVPDAELLPRGIVRALDELTEAMQHGTGETQTSQNQDALAAS